MAVASTLVRKQPCDGLLLAILFRDFQRQLAGGLDVGIAADANA